MELLLNFYLSPKNLVKLAREILVYHPAVFSFWKSRKVGF